MISAGWIAALSALFIWWFSTGAILIVVRHADRGGITASLRSVIFGLPMLFGGAALFWVTLASETVWAAYGAFIAAILIWGWIELSFLAGIITGPNHHDCPANAPEWERFIRAWGTIAYHEMLLVAALIAMWFVGWEAANTFGLWTFTVLFFARVSAKLNLFLGVPKINTEFLPSALSHLPGHFRIAALNWLFPVSITLLSLATFCWLERLMAADTVSSVTGFSLLAALTALALIEHWLLVLPLPDAKLWRWMLPEPRPMTPHKIPEDARGL